MTDIIIELGVVADIVAITDEIALYLTDLNIAISDPLDVQESPSVSLSALFIDVFEAISTSEWAFVLDITIEMSAYEAITAQDSLVDLYLDVLNVFVIQPMMIVITEHSDVLDIVIEVGIVSEYNTITEWAFSVLDVLNLSVEDSVAITEYASVLDIVIEMPLAEESIAIVEAVEAYPSELFVFEGEDITVAEQEAVSVGELFVNVYDETAVTDYANIHDIIVEMSAGEDISVAEDLALYLPSLNISEYEDVAVAEYATVFDIIIELGIVYEDISVAEWIQVLNLVIYALVFDDITAQDISIDMYMGLNFEVAEQYGGIQIVTVNW
jgi:hypothetical protein